MFLKQINHDNRYQALELLSPSDARTAVGAWYLANLAGLLSPNGLTALGHQIVDGTANVEDTLAHGIRDCILGQEGIEIVLLLQRDWMRPQ